MLMLPIATRGTRKEEVKKQKQGRHLLACRETLRAQERGQLPSAVPCPGPTLEYCGAWVQLQWLQLSL